MASAATIALAGCMSSGSDDGPAYDQDDEDDLILTVDAFDDEAAEWHRDDEFNENFDACFLTEDESVVVLAEVEIEDDVEAAEDQFDQSKSGAVDPSDYDLADEAFWSIGTDNTAKTMFRHSNALGQVSAIRASSTGPTADTQRSQQYASAMFDTW